MANLHKQTLKNRTNTLSRKGGGIHFSIKGGVSAWGGVSFSLSGEEIHGYN